jgi:hypothetical protein
MSRWVCYDCRAPVTWAVTEAGKRMPLDPQPNADGNQAAYKDGTGGWRTRQLKAGEEPYRHEKRYMPHFATCAKREKPTTPAPGPAATVLPENVIPISHGRELRRSKPLKPPAQRRGQR